MYCVDHIGKNGNKFILDGLHFICCHSAFCQFNGMFRKQEMNTSFSTEHCILNALQIPFNNDRRNCVYWMNYEALIGSNSLACLIDRHQLHILNTPGMKSNKQSSSIILLRHALLSIDTKWTFPPNATNFFFCSFVCFASPTASHFVSIHVSIDAHT